MAIVNRDCDASQQKDVYEVSIQNTITSATYLVAVIPYQAQILTANQAAYGLSGAPNHSLWISRFIVGSGATSINIGASLATAAFGTSGLQAFTCPGSVTFPLQAGDAIVLETAAANTGLNQVVVSLAVKKLQDIVSYWGF